MRHLLFRSSPFRALAVTGLLCLHLVSQARAQYTVTNTSANVVGNSTILNDAWLNNQPKHFCLVTHCWNPFGMGGAYINSQIGSWYNTGSGRANVFTENSSSMPLNTGFNVWDLDADLTAFVQQASAANTVGHITYINNAQTNGKPTARVFMSANWNPYGYGGVFNNHPTGVWYDAGRAQWAIYNQDSAPMPSGAAFTVKVLPPANTNDYAFNYYTHIATPNNSVGSVTYLTFGPAYAGAYKNQAVIVTPVFNPSGGSGGVYDTHNLGVFYDSGRQLWAIYHEDGAAITAGAAYNVRITPVP